MLHDHDMFSLLSLLTFSSLLKPRFQSLAAGTSRAFEDGNALYLADVVRIWSCWKLQDPKAEVICAQTTGA